MNRPLRYIVSRPGEPDTSYNCSLGNAQARSWSIANASLYGGTIWIENSEGDTEVFRDYRDRLPRRPPTILEEALKETDKIFEGASPAALQPSPVQV